DLERLGALAVEAPEAAPPVDEARAHELGHELLDEQRVPERLVHDALDEPARDVGHSEHRDDELARVVRAERAEVQLLEEAVAAELLERASELGAAHLLGAVRREDEEPRRGARPAEREERTVEVEEE